MYTRNSPIHVCACALVAGAMHFPDLVLCVQPGAVWFGAVTMAQEVKGYHLETGGGGEREREGKGEREGEKERGRE